MKSKSIPDFKKLPAHIGFIMDGNGRWAKKRLLPRKAGHKAGVETLQSTVTAAYDLGISCVTVYAFSTENAMRPEDEKQSLFKLISEYFHKSFNYFIENNVQVRFMGELDYFPADVRAVLEEIECKSANFSRHILNVGLNYGSRAEIIRAVNSAVKKGSPVSETEFESLLYTNGLPPLDLIVRTGGECRLSNFLMFQAAYAELYFTDVLWPDFKTEQLYIALKEFERRNRRYGKV